VSEIWNPQTNSRQSTAAIGGEANATSHQFNSDVRVLTKKIADTFMQPQNTGSDRPTAPKVCRFQWGSFVFVGMVSSYNETLDFFSPEGVPLRSTLALTLKEDRYRYEISDAQNQDREDPEFATTSETQGAAQAAAANGKNPKNWRDIALFNGIENARSIGQAALSIPKIELDKLQSRVGSPETGFGIGSSASLGSSIPGAFKWK
jgi:Contractile injection system tube protein